jgi:hypothetical protein
LLFKTGTPFLVQLTTGVGAPTIGKSMLIGSPALTRISLIGPKPPDWSNFGFSKNFYFYSKI